MNRFGMVFLLAIFSLFNLTQRKAIMQRSPNGEPTMFVGHFASLMKKHNGQWTFYRTSFDTRYRGPMPTQPTQD